MTITTEKHISKPDYRTAIRLAWLPLVGRKKLTSYESKLVNKWHADQIPLSWILRAIQTTKESRVSLYSIGIIRSHLARIEREQVRLQTGAGVREADWRAHWDEALFDLAEAETDPERRAMYNELRESLPSLSKEEAQDRYDEIRRLS